MEFMDVIRSRRSIRKYTQDPVPPEYIREILEAARLAPSGTNRQPWRFKVLRGDETEIVTTACPQKFVTEAPVLLVCCIDRRAFMKDSLDRRLGELVEGNVFKQTEVNALYKFKIPVKEEEVRLSHSAFIDLAIAVEHMVLAAQNLGLGSCWVRLMDPNNVHKALGLPPHLVVGALLPLGFPAEEPGERPRLSLEEITI